jgi:hypothetical protein
LPLIQHVIAKRIKQKWGEYSDIFSYTYYIYAIEFEDYIKVGCTYDLLSRISSFGPSNMGLLFCIKMDTREDAFQLERVIHADLKPYRHHSIEWYYKIAPTYTYLYKIYLDN